MSVGQTIIKHFSMKKIHIACIFNKLELFQI